MTIVVIHRVMINMMIGLCLFLSIPFAHAEQITYVDGVPYIVSIGCPIEIDGKQFCPDQVGPSNVIPLGPSRGMGGQSSLGHGGGHSGSSAGYGGRGAGHLGVGGGGASAFSTTPGGNYPGAYGEMNRQKNAWEKSQYEMSSIKQFTGNCQNFIQANIEVFNHITDSADEWNHASVFQNYIDQCQSTINHVFRYSKGDPGSPWRQAYDESTSNTKEAQRLLSVGRARYFLNSSRFELNALDQDVYSTIDDLVQKYNVLQSKITNTRHYIDSINENNGNYPEKDELESKLNQLYEDACNSQQGKWYTLYNKKKQSDTEKRIVTNIQPYFPNQIHRIITEFSKWNKLDQNQIEVIKYADAYNVKVQQFYKNPKNVSDYPYLNTVLEVGLDTLGEAAEIAGGTSTGNFDQKLDEVDWANKVLNASLPYLNAVLPVTSIPQDVFEAFSGKSIVDGSQLDYADRALSVLSILSLGESKQLIGAVQGLYHVAHKLKGKGLLGKGFKETTKLLGSGKLASILKKNPGIAIASKALPDSKTMLKGTNGNVGRIPKDIGDKLVGKTFKNWDHFRKKFWKEIPKSKYSSQFSPSQLNEMKQGLAPTAPMNQWHQKKLSSRPKTKMELHHIQPVHDGGGVYDMSNIAIVSPKVHQVILDSNYHLGK